MHLWHIENDTVRLQSARLTGIVDPANPPVGIHQLQLDQAPLSGMSLLGVELPAAATPAAKSDVDYYVRGGDLVATYAETPARPLRAQIYWRAGMQPFDHAIAAIELIASVQTSLLDSRPELMTQSELPAREAFQLMDPQCADFARLAPTPASSDRNEHPERAHCYLFRLPSAKISYAEMVHPADAQRSSYQVRACGADPEFRLRHQLFAERLEKGVILRARVLGVWLDREGDQAAAARHYATFSAAEPPLTT
ncbi:MAG: hypothetical protein HY288_16880 [Planctomycetia bacterium]|nr:hypothetical protein [Planctomycetia bacterium]